MNKMPENTRLTARVLAFLILLFAYGFNTVYAQPDGKKLFKANCAACHTTTDAKLVGPGLKGVSTRWTDKAKLYAWVKNSTEFLKTGDAYATSLFESYGKMPMSAFPDLKDEDIDAIINYIENPPQETTATPSASNTTEKSTSSEDSNTLLYLLIGLIILFVIIISVLSGVKKSLQKTLNQKKGLPDPEDLGYWDSIKCWMSENKKITALIILLLLCGGLKDGWDALMGIGVYQGYKPEQPIKFSHKIHAGDNAINCVYCHSSAERGKTAGIPSANVCMNCHKGIQQGTITGKTEIAKIYAALDYDPSTGQYGKNQKPIKWIKVHNLPDHVYFNHSQHVVIGKIACQTCHGTVEKMEVIEQAAPLTMGWCVNCHRSTDVKMEGNAYYDEIHNRLTDKLKAKYMKDGKITVDELGGIECAKCHY